MVVIPLGLGLALAIFAVYDSFFAEGSDHSLGARLSALAVAIVVGFAAWLFWRLCTRGATATTEGVRVRGLFRSRQLRWSDVVDLMSEDLVVVDRYVSLSKARVAFWTATSDKLHTGTVSASWRGGPAAAHALRRFAPADHPSRLNCPAYLASQTPPYPALPEADPRTVRRAPTLATYVLSPKVWLPALLGFALLLAFVVFGVIVGLQQADEEQGWIVAAGACAALAAAILWAMVAMVRQRVWVTSEGVLTRGFGPTRSVPWAWIGEFDELPSGLGAMVCIRRLDAMVIPLPATSAFRESYVWQVQKELRVWRNELLPRSGGDRLTWE